MSTSSDHSGSSEQTSTEQPYRWRDYLAVHPAADEMPSLPPDELQALTDDIERNGLRTPIVLWGRNFSDPDIVLLDGRHRLNALEKIGWLKFNDNWLKFDNGLRLKGSPRGPYNLPSSAYFAIVNRGDPKAHVLSHNVHRRHLTPEQRRDLITAAIAAHPEKSDRQIADELKVGRNVVNRARKQAEATGTTVPVERRIGKDGRARRQPAKKRKPMAPGTYVVEADGRKRKATEEELDAAAQFFTAIPDGVRAGEGCPATVEAKWTAAVREGRADEVAADWAARAAAAQNGGAKATEARGGSWRVELTTDDGRRLMNGARYGTKQEASLYAASGIHVAVFMNGLTVVAIRLLESGDAPNQSLRHPKDHRKAGQLRDTLAIKDGECVYHNWHVEGEETAPACGNDTDPEASAEAMKAKHAALDAMN